MSNILILCLFYSTQSAYLSICFILIDVCLCYFILYFCTSQNDCWYYNQNTMSCMLCEWIRSNLSFDDVIFFPVILCHPFNVGKRNIKEQLDFLSNISFFFITFFVVVWFDIYARDLLAILSVVDNNNNDNNDNNDNAENRWKLWQTYTTFREEISLKENCRRCGRFLIFTR